MNFKYDKDSIKILNKQGELLLQMTSFGGRLYAQDVKNNKMIDIMAQFNSKSTIISKMEDIRRKISFVEPSSLKIVSNKPDCVIKLNFYKYKNFDIHHGGGNLHLASPTEVIDGKDGRIIIHTRGFERTVTFGEKFLLPDKFNKTINKSIGISIFRYVINSNYICIEDVKHYPLP
jgi:hypothetical protein